MREERINNILKDLYTSAVNQDLKLTRGMVYGYLTRLNIIEHENNEFVNNDFFKKWIKRFSNKENIEVFNSEDWKYFCQFINGNVGYECVKIYVPLDYEHLYEGANQIFDFLAENNIQHCSKISSEIRSDNVVIRLKNTYDAKRLQEFIDNNEYIRQGLMKCNPFCFNKNGVGYAYDGSLSYNSTVAYLIAKYINDAKKNNVNINNINVSSFLYYIDKYGANTNNLISMIKHSNYKYSVCYAKLILDMIKLALTTENISYCFNFQNDCFSIDKSEMYDELMGIERDKTNQEDLLRELILTTMKKYPRGYDRERPLISGFNYIWNFLDGNIKGVTRDNNLRDRVSKYLSAVDAYNIISNSGIIGNSFEEKVKNYVKMVMLNDMIKCSCIRFGHARNVQSYVNTNDSNYITNRIGNARMLAYSFDSYEIENFLSNMGVKNIDEYIDKYYSDSSYKERRR